MDNEIQENNEELYISEEEAGWNVCDDASAEWCIKKIKEANAEISIFEAHFADQMAKIRKKNEARKTFFEGKLAIYFGGVPHKQAKTQESYALPSATLVLKRPGPEWHHDDQQLLPWVMKNCPDMIRVKPPEVNWSDFKKTLKVTELTSEDQRIGYGITTDDGEIVPGVTLTDRPDVFKVEVK